MKDVKILSNDLLNAITVPRDYNFLDQAFRVYTSEMIVEAIRMINNYTKRALLSDYYDSFIESELTKQENVDNAC